MTRLLLLATLCAGAAVAQAAIITQYEDSVWLAHHDTVRYRIEMDYGIGTTARLEILVRGVNAPPRVRVLDSNRKELRDFRDTDGDWKLEFGVTMQQAHAVYFVEVDSARPDDPADMDVLLTVTADPDANADAFISIDRIYKDYESGDDSDHHDCAAGAAGGAAALLPLSAIGILALRRRRLR